MEFKNLPDDVQTLIARVHLVRAALDRPGFPAARLIEFADGACISADAVARLIVALLDYSADRVSELDLMRQQLEAIGKKAFYAKRIEQPRT